MQEYSNQKMRDGSSWLMNPDVQQSDEYWESVVDESGQIAKKYDNAKLAIALLLAAIDELERKSKDIQKMPQNDT